MLYICKMLREETLAPLIKDKKLQFCEMMDV